MHKIMISGIQPDSIARELEIEAGDYLLSINGIEIRDIFDYRFHAANSELILDIEKKNGEAWSFEIEKDDMEDLGLEFSEPLLDEEKGCRNKCVFCFIDQLPKGMRETLYFKDDDARLSFLFGNYITMTNLNDEEIERIIRYRMSPVNISVHTTNPTLRMKMLNNRFAGDILEKIKRFTTNGITVNCQIVLCPGLNDGKELDQTIQDLAVLTPYMHSISVVPVGLTKYREGLFPLKPFDQSSAQDVVLQVEAWQQSFLAHYESRIVYLADEFYLMAEKKLPHYMDYEDFPQIENGVGMASSFIFEALEALSELDRTRDTTQNPVISVATGVSFYPLLREFASKAEAILGNLKLLVYPVDSVFFGGKVTVTGLLTGSDLIGGLKDKDLGDVLLLSQNMFRSGTQTLLDDMTLDELSENLKIQARIVDSDGASFVQALIEKIYFKND